MRRAVIYCRVSTKEQGTEKHYSLPLQRDHCKRYAEQKGWSVVDVLKDEESGRSTDNRPGYKRLLRWIADGELDVVVTYRLDRLSRNVRDVYDFLEKTREANVDFASTSESFDTTTAMGRAMLGVAAVFAQLAREMIGENVRDGLVKRAEAGKYSGFTGPGPYGYIYDKKDTHSLIVDPKEARVVRQIFHLYARKKWGVTRIARYLNERGIPTKGKFEWYQYQIRNILRSPLYIGKVRYAREEYDGTHQAIIGQDIFEETQQLIRGRATLPPRSRQSQHLLSGIARCARCNCRLRVHWLHLRGKDGSQPRKYRVYHHARGISKEQAGCSGLSKSADRLEGAVVERIREVALSRDFQEAAFEEAVAQLQADLPAVRAERDAVVAELSDLDRRFDLWASQLESGTIDADQFRKRNEALLREKAGLEERLMELETREAEADSVEVSLEQVRQALKDFDRVWDETTIDEKRELLRNLVEHLEVWKDRAELKLVFLPPMEIPVVFKRGPVPKGGSAGGDGNPGRH